MKPLQELALLGFASGIAASNPDCGLGPWYLYYHRTLFKTLAIKTYWEAIIYATSEEKGLNILPVLEKKLDEFARCILPLAKSRKPFCVLGGDHSSGIATWSAVAHANRDHGDIGLIWIDAHMDSHTFETTLSHNIHGMPVAHLLGFGEKRLHQLLDPKPKIKPENLCFICIRSYERGEALFLQGLGVKVFFMTEIFQRGLDAVFKEAIALVSKNTCGIGISIDLDAIDPSDAPGVGSPEPGGVNGNALILSLKDTIPKHLLLGMEIGEFNPLLDEDDKTAKLMIDLIDAVYGD